MAEFLPRFPDAGGLAEQMAAARDTYAAAIERQRRAVDVFCGRCGRWGHGLRWRVIEATGVGPYAIACPTCGGEQALFMRRDDPRIRERA